MERHIGQLPRDREDDVEVGNREQLTLAGSEPLVPRAGLALGAMAVAAGYVELPITCVMGSNSLWGADGWIGLKTTTLRCFYSPLGAGFSGGRRVRLAFENAHVQER